MTIIAVDIKIEDLIYSLVTIDIIIIWSYLQVVAVGSTLLWIYLTCSSEEAEDETGDLPGVKMSSIHSRYVTLITKPMSETANVLYGHVNSITTMLF